MELHPRTAWQLSSMPVVGPPCPVNDIVQVAIHYTASPKVDPFTASYLRAIHRDYTVNRGYSIGYNFAVCQLGRAWQLRGVDIKCAANKGRNHDTLAILVLVDGDDPANERMINTIRELVTLIRSVAPNARRIVGHRQIGATACPGAGLFAQVISGMFEPTAAPPAPVPAPAPSPPKITAAKAATTGDDMLRIIADASKPSAPERWVTNGMVRVLPTEHSLDWLTTTGQVLGTIQQPILVSPAVLAGLPLVG